MKIKLTVFLSLLTFSIFAQHQKFVYIEGGGSGVLLNANYDMRFKKDTRSGLGFKAGIGNSFYLEDGSATTLPLGINYLIGKNKSALLLGANTTFAFFGKETSKFNTSGYIPSLEIGYRYTPLKKGFSFQATYNPLFNTVDGFKAVWLGIGLGYSWK